MLQPQKIALIGAGNMAEALISGMLKAGIANSEHLIATDVSKDRLELLKERYNVQVSLHNLEAVAWAHTVILAIKPQVVHEVMEGIQPSISNKHLVISVAAGYPIKRLSDHLSNKAPVIRAMPNTPSILLEGVTAIAAGPGVSDGQIQLAQEIFEAVGKVVVIEEGLIDAVTGLSGSGPAYVYMIIEALADGGVRMGLPRSVAQLLATQTVLGSARMVLESGDPPGLLKDRVASPGGTTIAGIHKLEQGGIRGTLMDAVEAATRKSQELGG